MVTVISLPTPLKALYNLRLLQTSSSDLLEVCAETRHLMIVPTPIYCQNPTNVFRIHPPLPSYHKGVSGPLIS